MINITCKSWDLIHSRFVIRYLDETSNNHIFNARLLYSPNYRRNRFAFIYSQLCLYSTQTTLANVDVLIWWAHRSFLLFLFSFFFCSLSFQTSEKCIRQPYSCVCHGNIVLPIIIYFYCHIWTLFFIKFVIYVLEHFIMLFHLNIREKKQKQKQIHSNEFEIGWWFNLKETNGRWKPRNSVHINRSTQ